MKKILAVAILLAAIVPNICFAMNLSEFTLGGVRLNMPYSEVIRMYGEPTSKPGGWTQLVTDCIKYGNDIEIGFLGQNVRYVVTTADNGWKTAAGVYVGMNINDVIRIYGNNYTTENKSVKFEHQKEHLLTNLTGTAYIWSQVADSYSYNPGDTKFVLSVIVNNDKVTAITLSQQTPEY